MTTQTPAPQPDVIRPTGRSGRGVKTLGDMARSLVFVVLAIFVLFGGFLFVAYRYHGKPQIQRVDSDVAGILPTAASQAPYRLLAPQGLPQAWAPTSVNWSPSQNGSPAVLQIGYITPSQKFLSFVESDGPVEGLLSPYQKSPVAAGTATVGGLTWTVSRSTDGSLTYQRAAGSPTVGVDGGATKAEIEQFLASVRPYSAAG